MHREIRVKKFIAELFELEAVGNNLNIYQQGQKKKA